MAEKIQHAVSLNVNAFVIPPNVCETSTSLKEWGDNRVSSIKTDLHLSLRSVKVHMTGNFFISLFKRAFKNDQEWWCFFYCDSTLGCRVIQDFDLCKLDYVTMWTQNDVKSQKMEYLWRIFIYRTETLYSYYTHHKVPWYVHCDISMATQWAPGPFHSKGKIRVFLLQEVLFALFVHSVGVSEYGHYTA